MNSRAAHTLQGASISAKSPIFNPVFTMKLPDGVTLKSFSSSPKLATTPTIVNGFLTWNVGSDIKASGKIKIRLNLVASSCSTPDALELIGRFDYADSTGYKTVDACLKKPLYVWTKGCAAIPKAGLSGGKTSL